MTIRLNTDNTPYEKIGNADPVSIADEVPFDIPDSWEWCRLSSVNDMYTGNSINETEKKLKYTGLVNGYNYIGTYNQFIPAYPSDMEEGRGFGIALQAYQDGEPYGVATVNVPTVIKK